MKGRYLTVMVLLVLAAVTARFVGYDTYNNPEQGISAIAQIPLHFGQWQGKDLPLEEKIYEVLETRSIIHRSYSSPSGESVFLSIVYYTETKVDFHAPEGCLAGQGVQVTKEEKVISLHPEGREIQLGLNQLVRREEGTDTLVYYFYKAGKFLGQNYVRLRFNLVVNKLTSEEKSGSLIRVTAPIAPGPDGEEKAAATLRNFLEGVYPYLLRL
jgi:EpsI family protein